MVLVDFSLAFNCVRHQLLQTKLAEEFGFSHAACDLVRSFLEGRSQIVKLGNELSQQRQLTAGTPQGSCLSALLFGLYVNSLPYNLQCQYHMYADDLQVYISGPPSEIDRLIGMINQDLATIEQWSNANGLSPNPKKTQAIIFSKSRIEPDPMNSVTFCGETIQFSPKVVNLGLIMDSSLKWDEHVNDTVAKVFNVLRTFRRFGPVLETEVRLKLVQSVIMPIFTYCDIVYFPGLSAAQKERLHRCFKASLRFVYNLSRRTSTVPVRNTVVGQDLPDNYHHRICCFFRQVWFNTVPEYIQQHLPRSQMDRTRNFAMPVNTTTSRKSLLNYGVAVWNRLPIDIKMKPSVSTFKSALRVPHH